MRTRSHPIWTQVLFVALQLGDVVTTLTTLSAGGVELNPLISRLMGIGGLTGLILSKVVLLGVAVIANRTGKLRVLVLANVAFGAVVLWNLSVIVRIYLMSHPQ